MPDTPTTALVKTATSPALARVSSQLALTNKLLTKPEEPFLIPYRKGNKWGFCDRNKNIVIDCIWDEVRPFEEGLAVVSIKGRYGYIDKKGKTAIQPVYQDATSFCFSEDRAGVRLNDAWLIIDKKNQVLEEIMEEDFSWVESYEKSFWDAGLDLILSGSNNYGYIDTHGTEYWED